MSTLLVHSTVSVKLHPTNNVMSIFACRQSLSWLKG